MENQNLATRSFQQEFKEMLTTVFGANAYFGDFFAGGLEALDGVQHNETAFHVKTSDIPVLMGEQYVKDGNTAFGTGTGNSTRFGPRQEIIYTDTPVPYTWEWAFHEGIDRHTVNNAFDDAVADRLELQAKAKTRMFNRHHRDFIAASAGHVEALDSYEAQDILALFNRLSKYFVNIEAQGVKIIKVCSDLYNMIVDHPLVTAGKHSSVDIDENGMVKFKGFLIQEIPDDMFAAQGSQYAAFAYMEGIGKAFTGITTARTKESEDFDGMALQGAGKAGEFIPADNQKAVVAVTAPVGTP